MTAVFKCGIPYHVTHILKRVSDAVLWCYKRFLDPIKARNCHIRGSEICGPGRYCGKTQSLISVGARTLVEHPKTLAVKAQLRFIDEARTERPKPCQPRTLPPRFIVCAETWKRGKRKEQGERIV